MSSILTRSQRMILRFLDLFPFGGGRALVLGVVGVALALASLVAALMPNEIGLLPPALRWCAVLSICSVLLCLLVLNRIAEPVTARFAAKLLKTIQADGRLGTLVRCGRAEDTAGMKLWLERNGYGHFCSRAVVRKLMDIINDME